MINRISEIPFWGPEEQIRRFVNQHDEDIPGGQTQQTITQQRIENLDEIYQKQLIWSYGLKNVDDAYFYQDWCPIGDHVKDTPYNPNPKWQMDLWGEAAKNIQRSMDRSFNYKDFVGYQMSEMRRDEMPSEYSASSDEHALEQGDEDNTDLDVDTLRHNIMWSYLEVSEWLGDGATAYGSQNGFVSRKMSLSWLFNAIKALINWKLANQDKWAEEDVNPLVIPTWDAEQGKWVYELDSNGNQICERFLDSGEKSTRGIAYDDFDSLDQSGGCCKRQKMVRAKDPEKNGTLKVRGNEWHYGERAYFYTHNSFVGECRFFHNARFLGQATFDKEIAGTALRSRWSDICEYYVADKKYEPGTLIMFGGDNEMTISDGYTVNGIVTTKPGFILNGDATKSNELSVGIALVGRVPVNVVGKVYKFDKLVPSRKFPGYAIRKRWYQFFRKPIGIALSDSNGGQVECVTKLNF